MSYPKKMSRMLDGKPQAHVVHSAEEERQAKVKGFFVDENQDGVPDAPDPEFPKMLHGVDKDGQAITKVVKDAAEEKAALAKGWKLEPKQDHGPVVKVPAEPEPVKQPDEKKGKK